MVRTPRGPHSCAHVAVRLSTPARAAEECDIPTMPRCGVIVMVTLAILPKPAGSIERFATCVETYHVASRLSRSTARKPL